MGKKIGEELGQETGERKEVWYIMNENAERPGKKGRRNRKSYFYRSRKYNLSINIFSTLGYNHGLKKKKEKGLIY